MSKFTWYYRNNIQDKLLKNKENFGISPVQVRLTIIYSILALPIFSLLFVADHEKNQNCR